MIVLGCGRWGTEISCPAIGGVTPKNCWESVTGYHTIFRIGKVVEANELAKKLVCKCLSYW